MTDHREAVEAARRTNFPPDSREDLALKFEQAAKSLRADRQERFGLLDVKFFLLAALNDTDRALDYGHPGAGIDQLLGEHYG
jgi:hypothetical protein